MPLPNTAAILTASGFKNSFNAPPCLLKTIPVRRQTNRFCKPGSLEVTGAIEASHAAHVVPKKSGWEGSVSTKPCAAK